MIEVLGFAGSILIIVSLTMKSIVRLRIIGVMGALVFMAYGCWLQAWPVVATNTVTFSIHLYQLRILAMEGRLAIGGRTVEIPPRQDHSQHSAPAVGTATVAQG